MSSYEITTLKNELDSVEAVKKNLHEKEDAWAKFLTSDDFFKESNKFLEVWNAFSNSLVSLGNTLKNPILGVPHVENPLGGEGEVEEGKAERAFGRGKALVVAAAIIACAVVTIEGLMAPVYLLGIAGGSVCLMFLPNLRELVVGLLHRNDEEEEENLAGEDWITESMSKMLDEYNTFRKLIKVQDQDKNNLPEYADVDESLFSTARSAAENLPFEFLGRTTKIMYACDQSILARKVFIMNCMAKQASVVQQGPHA